MRIWVCLTIFVLGIMFFTVDAAAMVTGNDWKTWQGTEQEIYLLGVYNGWQIMVNVATHPDLGPRSATDEFYRSMLYCVGTKNMTYRHLVAMTRQFMENNPSVWHENMPDILLRVLETLCPFKPVPERE